MVPDEIAERGYLNVGTITNYAPFAFQDEEGNPAGIDIELLTAIAEELGLEVKFTTLGFEALFPAVANGRFDIAGGGIGDFADRHKTFLIVDAYETRDSLLVPKGNPLGLDESSTLCGLHLGTGEGSFEVGLMEEYSQQCTADGKEPIEISVYPEQTDVELAIASGRLDGMPRIEYTNIYFAKNGPGNLESVPVNLPGSSSLNGYIIDKNNGELADAVQAALQNLAEDGTYREIMEKWDAGKGVLDEITINGGATYESD